MYVDDMRGAAGDAGTAAGAAATADVAAATYLSSDRWRRSERQ